MTAARVYGVRETIAELRQVDSKVASESIKTIKAAAEPLRAAIAGELAQPTLSGLADWWPGGRVTTNYGGRATGTDTRPLVRVRVIGKGQSVADMAGRRSSGRTNAGRALIDNLSRRAGSASRFAWAAAEKSGPDVERAVLDACATVTAQVNSALLRT